MTLIDALPEIGLARETDGEVPFGVYVHWPFCKAKCPYCDFNSHVRYGGIDEARFWAAYSREIAHFAHAAPGRTVSSIFFGGGTPSLMSAETAAAILDAIAEHWPMAPDVEITLEANPTSVEAERFAGYRAAGVNRVSLGVQALDDAALRQLGRQHSAEEALAAVALAKRHFPRVSFDLIYARPGQTEADWAAELQAALSHAVGHVSLYQLTIEDGTPFAALRQAGHLRVPGAVHARSLYLLTQEICEAAGLRAYEISSHAKIGEESRHNLVYWRGHDYVGTGPGAHSRITRGGTKHALVTTRLPEDWLAAVEAKGDGVESDVALSQEEAADEYLLMSLRLLEGADLARLAELGLTPRPEGIAALEEQGLVARQGTWLCATREGRLVLERLILELAA
jgi:putative oxygen-independent coproporphyrinogen III oxidase